MKLFQKMFDRSEKFFSVDAAERLMSEVHACAAAVNDLADALRSVISATRKNAEQIAALTEQNRQICELLEKHRTFKSNGSNKQVN